MKLPTYRKETNKFAFQECKIWDFQRGYYNDGNNQYIVSFAKDSKLSSFCKHYYRLHRFDDNDHSIYWLILNPFKNFVLQCVQNGVFKTVISPLSNLVKSIISLIK